jgi:hypothetical protein
MNEQFLRYLASTAENKDPITPFSRIPTIDKKLQIKVNTTNDLKWLIDKSLVELESNDIDFIIIGDQESGYSSKILKTIEKEYDNVSISKDSEWIIVKINTLTSDLIISNQTIKIG